MFGNICDAGMSKTWTFISIRPCDCIETHHAKKMRISKATFAGRCPKKLLENIPQIRVFLLVFSNNNLCAHFWWFSQTFIALLLTHKRICSRGRRQVYQHECWLQPLLNIGGKFPIFKNFFDPPNSLLLQWYARYMPKKG